jgi:GDP-4-dehydro-6-deoxy-D-mannose reductase
MRALITGISGFVGGYLAEHLLATGEWDVYGVAREAADLGPSVCTVTADLTQPEAVRHMLARTRPDVVFHLAAQSNVHQSFSTPETTLLTNVLPELYLFEAVRQLGQDPLLLIVGSNEIYGHVKPEDLPINEETPFRPVSPYAVSKAAQDLLAYQYHASYGLRTVRLRPFNHIGPRQREQFVASAFAAQIARIEAGQQEPLLRVGNLDAERDFTDVRDVVRAYEAAARHATVGAAYNIGSGHAVKVRWLLDTLLAFSERAITVETDPARMRPADIPRVVCDSSRFRHATGWEPRIPLEQTIHDILNYWRGQVA